MGKPKPSSKFEYHGDGVLSKVRGDGKRVFYIRYQWQGKRITEKIGLSEKRARGRIESRREQMEDPAYIPEPVKRKAATKQPKITFPKFADRFYRDHGSKRASAKTWFYPMGERMKREFGRVELSKITPYQLERFVTKRSKKVTPTTVNHDIRFLKNLFSRAVDWGFLETSPAAKVQQLKEPPPRERFLSQTETDKLIAVCAHHLRPAVQMALLTGMRRAEILRLTWDRVHLDRRLIHLQNTKNGKARWVPICDDLHAILKAIPRHVTHNRVFTYRGKPMDSLKRSWEAAREEASLPDARFHDLRHTWASRMVADGVGLYELMEMGGWSDVAMVRRYAHFAPERKLQTAQRLNGTAGQVATPVATQPS